jgi:glycosyltransferase involved in cell wall biosynthesis
VSSGKTKRLFMLGAFPPPVHGMAVVNQQMHQALRDAGVAVQTLDIAAHTLYRGWLARTVRAQRVASCAVVFFLAIMLNRVSQLYLSVSGGPGQIYEALFVALARLRGMPVSLHHHSFAYLDERKSLTALLCWVAGSQARHIVLCEPMGKKIAAVYPQARRVVVLSNAAFIKPASASGLNKNGGSITVGFLGNISPEKGIDDVARLISVCAEQHIEVQFLIGGPTQDAPTQAKVESLVKRHESVEYLGPLAGAQKAAFFERIDLLVFPTRYKNEAEPLTILEALASSVPVMANDRGCICAMLPDQDRLCVAAPDAFAARASTLLAELREDPNLLLQMRLAAKARFDELQREAAIRLSELIGSLADTGEP